LRWLLPPEENGLTFKYLTEKKNVVDVMDDLPRLDIDNLKIQEVTEKSFTIIPVSDNTSIINIKLTIHTNLIFKEQAKVKGIGLREKGLIQPHYSIQNI
jgi:hypothetical protein